MRGASGRSPTSETFAARRWEDGRVRETRDAIAAEVAVAIVYNGTPHVVMMATPADLPEFATGFTLTEGIVREPAEILRVVTRRLDDGIEANVEIVSARARELSRRQRNLTGRVGCGLCGAQTLAQAIRRPARVRGGASIRPDAIGRAMAALAAGQPLHAETGAVHAAAWMDADGGVALVREDVGRHNALDKLIGAMIAAGTDRTRGAVLLTSRASYEIVQKAASVGVGIVCAVSAPTALAIRLAEDCGVTLAAFVRGGRCTVYSHDGRIAAVEGVAA